MTSYIPDAGDIVWIDFTPHAGAEQAGRRPSLVLSPSSYNSRAGLLLACPITTKVKGYPFEVALPSSSKVKGVVLSDHVKSLDWRQRNASLIERGDAELRIEVLRKLGALLQMPEIGLSPQ